MGTLGFPTQVRSLELYHEVLPDYREEIEAEPLKPQDLLRNCADLVDQRQKTHGDFRANMRDYARELAQEFGAPVLPSHAAMTLVRNKLSRMNVGDAKELDHYLDAANYIIFAGILATEGE